MAEVKRKRRTRAEMVANVARRDMIEEVWPDAPGGWLLALSAAQEWEEGEVW